MTPQPPEGAPKAGERYRKWTGESVRVLAVFYDIEDDDWHIVVSHGRGVHWSWPVAFWLQPVRGDDGQPTPRFAREE